MDYIAARRDAYEHPRHVLDGVRSLLMLTLDYQTTPPAAPPPGRGQVSRYAWSHVDYHDTIHARLKQLVREANGRWPEARFRGVVDSAPLMEREFAMLAGIGWIGKHTLLMNRGQGSYFFLAALLTDLELEYSATPAVNHCGTCTACLDACPTQAFPQPGVLDATRCISYLTIEHDGPIPHHLRAGVGSWVFGCDVCQDVCPWNSRSTVCCTSEFAPRHDHDPLDLAALFDLDDEAFRQRFRKTPIWRARRRGLLRNAAVALGNQADRSAIPALLRGLHDHEPLVRGACAWALGECGAIEPLRQRLASEPDADVQAEIQTAIARPTASA
jgi:epoxyqueuosine reductase